jgi:hypothetical protein
MSAKPASRRIIMAAKKSKPNQFKATKQALRQPLPAAPENPPPASNPPVDSGAAEPTTAPSKAAKAPKAKSAKAPKPEKPKNLSALDAAAKVLADTGQAMSCGELIEAMTKKGLWTSPNGLTPGATIYAAILREMKIKGDAARFVKTERGKFAAKT